MSVREVKKTSGIERERDPEREHDLREHERPRRVDADRDDDERRQPSSRGGGP